MHLPHPGRLALSWHTTKCVLVKVAIGEALVSSLLHSATEGDILSCSSDDYEGCSFAVDGPIG